jgi:hypothetical protein
MNELKLIIEELSTRDLFALVLHICKVLLDKNPGSIHYFNFANETMKNVEKTLERS